MRRLVLIPLFTLLACGGADSITGPTGAGSRCRSKEGAAGLTGCRDYRAGWTFDEAKADCAARGSELEQGKSCDDADLLGRCLVEDRGGIVRLSLSGAASGCSAAFGICESLAPGAFAAAAACTGTGGQVTGHCAYRNKYGGNEECRDYVGQWSTRNAAADCESWDGTLQEGSACPDGARIGQCIANVDGGRVLITFLGTDTDNCSMAKFGCETFARGAFTPEPVCQ